MSNTWRPDETPSVPMALAIQAIARTCPDIDFLLGPTGPIAHAMGIAYEDRPAQRAVANTIRRAQKQRLPALTEAGTGSGKSVSALVPSILHAMETKKPVVVSTKTVLLQGQYVDKDLPFLHAALAPWMEARYGRNFKFAALYGRGRYYCEARGARTQSDYEFGDELNTIAEWLESTEDGLLGGLPFDITQHRYARLKRMVTAEREDCPGSRCPVAKDGGCWFYAARKAVREAEIIVVNHALLLMALLATPGTVLPIWDAVVIDEAHEFEHEARKALGMTFTAAGVRRVVKRAYAFLGENWQGMLAEEGSCCPESHGGHEPDCPNHFVNRHAAAQGPTPSQEAIDHELDAFFRALEHQLRAKGHDGDALLPDLAATAAEEHMIELKELLGRLATDVESAGEMHWEESAERAQAETLRDSLRALGGQLLGLRSERAGRVAWLQMGGDQRPPALHAQPVEVGEFLKDSLWKTPCALSSATLATGSGNEAFRYVEDTLGVRTLHQCQVGSPFDWQQQAWLYTPEEGLHEGLLGLKVRGAAERERLAREYARVSALHIREVLNHTKGRTLLLFTSRQGLRFTQEWLGDLPWPHITQGEMGQADTLQWFRESKGVLFALASYWEGIDVVGDALSCVIIDRLPLPPPSDLVHEARLRRAGGGHHAFLQLSVPYATMKLKQGFGRLIRGRTDRGLCVLLDPRFRTKDYGRAIISSLPPARRINRADLRHVPWHLAAAGEPVPGDPQVAEALRRLAASGTVQGDHRVYLARMVDLLGESGTLPRGLWNAGKWLCDKYQNVSETIGGNAT